MCKIFLRIIVTIITYKIFLTASVVDILAILDVFHIFYNMLIFPRIRFILCLIYHCCNLLIEICKENNLSKSNLLNVDAFVLDSLATYNVRKNTNLLAEL